MAQRLTRFGKKLFTKPNILLLLLGSASLVLYRVGLRAAGTEDIKWFIKLALGQCAIYFLAAWLVTRAGPARSTVLLAIAFAVLFRLSILFSPPYLSDDLYRYVWDGRVQAAGINPYRYVPVDPALAHLRDESIYPEINRRDYARTIYPPVAQILFFLTTRISETVTWMKLTMFSFELIAVWAIAQLLASYALPQQRLLLYAWHPLIVWEFAGSGHLDAMAIALILLTFLAVRRNGNAVAGGVLAAATLTKFFPAVLFPAVYKRWDWKLPLVFVIAIIIPYLTYLSVGLRSVIGFLPGYVSEQRMISGEQFYVLSLARRVIGVNVPTAGFLVFVVLLMIGIAIWTLLRSSDRERLKAGLVLATATTVLFAPHYSWYFTWLVPFLCFWSAVGVFYLTAASFILYGSWLGDAPDQMFSLNSYLYLPFVLIAMVEFAARRWRFEFAPARLLRRKQTIGNPEG